MIVLVISGILNIAHIPLPEDKQIIKSLGNSILKEFEILFLS